MVALLPFAPFLLVRYFASEERISTASLRLASSIPIPLMCALFFAAPYHLQKYRGIEHPSYDYGIGTDTSILTAVESLTFIAVALGFVIPWLFISLLLLIFGELKNKRLTVSIKIAVAAIIYFCAINMLTYNEAIGDIFD